MVEVVGADSVTALTPADLAFPVGRMCIFLCLAGFIQETGAENTKCLGFVFELASFVLAGNNKTPQKERVEKLFDEFSTTMEGYKEGLEDTRIALATAVQNTEQLLEE